MDSQQLTRAASRPTAVHPEDSAAPITTVSATNVSWTQTIGASERGEIDRTRTRGSSSESSGWCRPPRAASEMGDTSSIEFAMACLSLRRLRILALICPTRLAMAKVLGAVSYTHLRAHETPEHLVCRLLLEKKKK
eukprot:TRINITY_DN59770_c0_g1_i2.p1 TRINITY_DN59770_c0_g1~~TRINITY_DN59770_c0_g1_i2.p1  ORF type:complete len:136 (-),score=12.97 TRINITY_DN59770_c0_g1_i2:93-500(-)